MSNLPSMLVAASAAIVAALGMLHLLFTFRGEKLYPGDSALVQRMKEVAPVISRQTTVWRAGLGFHASHSLGAMLFGLVFAYFALIDPPAFFASTFLLVLGLAYLAAMTVLAKQFWFSVPFRGLLGALALYVAGVIASAV